MSSMCAWQRAGLFGVRSRREERPQLPLCVGGTVGEFLGAMRGRGSREWWDARRPGSPTHATRRSKAVAPMHACAVHLRDRTPNLPSCFRSRIWTAVAEGGTTAATAFRRLDESASAWKFSKAEALGRGGTLAGRGAHARHETLESGGSDAGLRLASAQPH